MLEALLGTTDRVVQEIDSVEYGLTDIQEYYANTGRARVETNLTAQRIVSARQRRTFHVLSYHMSVQVNHVWQCPHLG